MWCWVGCQASQLSHQESTNTRVSALGGNTNTNKNTNTQIQMKGLILLITLTHKSTSFWQTRSCLPMNLSNYHSSYLLTSDCHLLIDFLKCPKIDQVNLWCLLQHNVSCGRSQNHQAYKHGSSCRNIGSLFRTD